MTKLSNCIALLCLALLLCSSSLVLGRQVAGKATYIDADSSRIMIMYFNSNSSVFFYNRSDKKQRTEKVETGSNGEMQTVIIETDPEGETVYKDASKQEMLSRHMHNSYYKPRYFGDIIVKEELPNIEWEISDQTKQIGSFNCYLAKTTYKKRVFYAWFSYEIPVPFGPWELGGLPGLILEAYDETKRFSYLCTQINIPTEVEGKIVPPKDGEVISWEEYVDLHIGVEERLNNWVKAKLAAKGKKSSVYISLSNFALTKPEGLMLIE